MSDLIISKDIKEYETKQTLKESISILKLLEGKTIDEIKCICRTVMQIANSNAKL